MDAVISEIIEEAPNTVTFRVKLPEEINFHAGQFFMVGKEVEKDGHMKFVKRAYSVASSPSQKRELDFTVRETEKGLLSPVLVHDLRVGEKIRVEGPYGKFRLTDEEDPEKVTLICAGSGIAPLRSILLHCLERENMPVTLLYMDKTPDDLIYKHDLVNWKNKVDLHISITRPEGTTWDGPTGRIDKERLAELIEPSGNFYLCGPPPMVIELSIALMELGVKKEDIRKEQYW